MSNVLKILIGIINITYNILNGAFLTPSNTKATDFGKARVISEPLLIHSS
jgi:hypothetical protein